MKRNNTILFISLLFLLTLFLSFACSNTDNKNTTDENSVNKPQPTDKNFNLDGITWDITEEELTNIIKKEGKYYWNKGNNKSVCFRFFDIYNYLTQVQYGFKAGSLEIIIYFLKPIYSYNNSNDYIKIYDTYQRYFENKFGTNYTDEIFWRNTKYKNNKKMLNVALVKQHVSLNKKWIFKDDICVLHSMRIINDIGLMHVLSINKCSDSHNQTDIKKSQ